MARTSVEKQALTDPRFTVLGSHLDPLQKMDRGLVFRAVGIYMSLQVWDYCSDRGLLVVHRRDLEAIHPGLAVAMIDAELVEVEPRSGGKRLRIKGGSGRLDWSVRARSNGELGKEHGRKGADFGKLGGRPKNKPPGGGFPVDKPGASKTPPNESSRDLSATSHVAPGRDVRPQSRRSGASATGSREKNVETSAETNIHATSAETPHPGVSKTPLRGDTKTPPLTLSLPLALSQGEEALPVVELGSTRANDGRATRSRGKAPDRRPEPTEPDDHQLDVTDPARAEGQRWKLYVAENHPNLTQAISPLRCVGKYPRSGKHVFDVDTRPQRDTAKTALQQAGGPELAAAVVIRIRPERVFGSTRPRRTRDDSDAVLREIQTRADQAEPEPDPEPELDPDLDGAPIEPEVLSPSRTAALDAIEQIRLGQARTEDPS